MFEELMKVEDLKTYSRRANLMVKVVSKDEPRSVVSRRDGSTYRVAEALVGDETGCVLLNLWNKDIDRFDIGDVVLIKNGYVKLFRGSIRLNIGRYGTAETVDREIEEVNTENNLSKSQFPRRGFGR